MAASVPVKAGALALLAAAALGLWLLREGPGDSRPSASDDDAERVAKVARTAEAPRLEAGPPARSSDAAASGRRLRVLDPDRRPLPGASVYRVPPGAIYVSSADRWAAETDAEGVVRVPASALSSGGLLLARRAGFVPGTLDPRAWAEGPEAEIVLGRGETVSGVVVDPWGAPLPDVEVHAHRGALFNAPFATEDLWPGIDAASRHQTTRSDAQGRFVLTGIARFPVQLTARKPHWVCVIRREHDVRESRDDVRLVLHPIGRLGVRALDAVSRLPLRTFDARSADERFLFPGPPAVRPNECWLTCPVNAEMGPGRPGTMSVVVAAWGYRRKTVDLALRYPEDEAFEEPQEVFLDPLPTRDALGRVTLRAAYPALGRAPDQVRVALHSDRLDLAPLGSAENPMGSKARASQLVFLEQGQTTVDLPAGVYEIALEGPGVGPRPPEWRAFEVNRGETTTVDLTVPGSIVHVRAYGPGRIPVPFFHVQATAKASMTMRWHGLLLDPEPWIEDEARMYGAERGRISLGLGASTEPLRIGVAADGFQSWSQPLLVEEGKSYEIEALLEPEAESR